ncbi:tRNA dimethylallyltransferase [Magnetospirillum sp. LM-5]|uniref:tRNA (adenosine(37)-N6)-dimethylallyltransferase MiaA n=1 Tax=Magnetospirillum sp. LM-5 TaxID=2681466 RepID=UPI00138118F7|nr:tRNA (adenosine(37)-N6)-dimethylallyltransferase MiaA [Magnetospirillum sp. LM-5]CAA7623831.1 tRNA dimethylallyltransferase [Magnetospirillum sp. LM-5]
MNTGIVVAGPTASGKSALALAIARKFDGVVINADSMQVYDVLRVVTARPSAADEAQAPHRLYGVLAPSIACSAALWRDMAAAEIQAAWAAGRLPVVVGGTGLYIRTLTQGISPIPEIPEPVRATARALLAEMGNQRFHALLAERDPVMAARLDVGNSQRLARAFEVIEATGRSLAEWQADPREGALPARWLTLSLAPPRDALYAACAGRFRQMVQQGALDEVASLLALDLDPTLPACKALGVPELAAHIRGQCDLEAAINAATQATRNYAKRQLTWFRHQLDAPEVISAQFSESIFAEIFPKIRHFLLTGAA